VTAAGRARGRRLAIALLACLGPAIVGCGGPTSSISTALACGPANERAPGALPELEALLPRGMIERSPDLVDSGWSCSPDTLATYAAHGVTQLRFAGATWNQGPSDGTVVAILVTRDPDPPLEAAWVEEFYETGARRSTKTENIEVTRPNMAGAGTVYRLETLNDLSLQTVVIWADAPYVHVVIVATEVAPGASRDTHNQRVDIAVDVAAGVPIPAGASAPAAS
jgi:hypothetical protein